MCVAAIAWRAHPDWRLVAIANRDEYHDRETAPLSRWDDGSGILAGRDLRAGGTWLGVGPQGRFALVTNFRKLGYPRTGLASRGSLVSDWLRGRVAEGKAPRMNPFHLLRTDSAFAEHETNWPEPRFHPLAPGIHGVSNGAFDTPWAKTMRLTAALAAWLARDDADTEPLFAALADETQLPAENDSEGPEQRFSPVFIRDPAYGTRSSTVVLIDDEGAGEISERRFGPDGAPQGATILAFG